MRRRLITIRRWLLRLAVAAAVLAIAVVAYVYDYPRVAADLPDAARDYRAAGLPWTAADLAPNPPVRPGENAAPGLRAALAVWPHRTLTWNGKTELAYVDPLGLVALKGGDDAGAVTDLEDARRLGVLVESEPTILSAFVGASCETSALKAVLRCLTKAADDPHRLEIYSGWLARPTLTIDLNRALRGELYSLVATLRNVGPRDMMPDPLRLKPGYVPELTEANTPLRRDGFPPDLRDRAYLARCLRRWAELAEVTHGLTDPVDRIGQEAEAIETNDQALATAVSFYDGLLFPVWPSLGRTNRTLTARRALALAFADALILHSREGRWPASVPFPDPLGEGDLKVRLDGGRFRVYSVGEDGRDDGGLAPGEVEGPGPRGRDIAAAYPPVKG